MASLGYRIICTTLSLDPARSLLPSSARTAHLAEHDAARQPQHQQSHQIGFCVEGGQGQGECEWGWPEAWVHRELGRGELAEHGYREGFGECEWEFGWRLEEHADEG